MRTITVTGKDRPELFRDMLISLRRNDLAGWHVLIAIDGDRGREFAEIARDHLSGVSYELTVNPVVLGIKGNPYFLISRAFATGSALNLYLEEDLLVSPDATELALWYERHHRPQWACVNLVAGACGSAGLLSNPDWPHTLFEARTFNSLGFAVRRAEWLQLMAPVWLGDNTPLKTKGPYAGWRTHWGWDWSVYGAIVDSRTMVSLQPVLSRVTHTGRIGTYVRPAFHDLAFGNMAIHREPNADFHVAEVESLPHPLRSHIQLQREATAMLLAIDRTTSGNDGVD